MSWNSGLYVQAGLCLLCVRPVGSQLPTRRDIHRQVGMSLAFLLFLDIIVCVFVCADCTMYKYMSHCIYPGIDNTLLYLLLLYFAELVDSRLRTPVLSLWSEGSVHPYS